jgi:glycosyltransferase involved in cell wall biosynthesis
MILQVNKIYSPEIGGVETVVKEYSEYLNTYENVVVLCVNKNFSLKTKIEVINNIKIYRCASFGTYLSMPISIVFFFYLFFLSRKANIIHFHEPFPLGSIGSLLIPKSKKIIVTWHSDIVKQKYIKNIFEFFQKRLCDKATNIISTSDNLIEFSSILKLFKKKVVTIPLSLDINAYKGHIAYTQNNTLSENLPNDYILFLGRFSYYKGIFVLLEAIEKIDESIPFVIVGNGELHKEILDKVRSSKKNITLIDKFISEDEKKYLIQKSKFMVFPSIFSSEAFGIIQLESMIYGKPVINTNLPTGVPWVSLDGESGLTVSINNKNELADAIIKLYNDSELYKKLSIGAKERINKLFLSEVANKKLYELYFENSKIF